MTMVVHAGPTGPVAGSFHPSKQAQQLASQWDTNPRLLSHMGDNLDVVQTQAPSW